jgi:molecular chaperone Hsp33
VLAREHAMTSAEVPSRAPSAVADDDVIQPFEVAELDVRGRQVRLGAALDKILSAHAYPTPVAKLLGEAVVLAILLGSSLKFEGRFILQTQSDGPVNMLVVDFISPGQVRACARYNNEAVARIEEAGSIPPSELLGTGHLAMTIDQGGDMNRYQGLVALAGGSLEDAAHEYFLRSEQIPTRVRIAVAEELIAGEDGLQHRWRAGGMLLQFLPRSPDRMRQSDLDPGDAPEGITPHEVPEDEAWVEARSLVETVTDIELVDTALSSERLLYRLFHERGVRVFIPQPVEAKCTCSRENVTSMLASFSQDDRDHMVENGKISVTCEFCSTQYIFEPEEVGANPAS